MRVSRTCETFYTEISKIPPNVIGKISTKGLSFSEYKFSSLRTKSSCKSAIQEFSEMFEESVAQSNPKNLKIGLMLSGGLDSSAISIALKNIGCTDTITFSGNWHGKNDQSMHPSDESQYQQAVSKHTGFAHVNIPLNDISPIESIRKHSEILGSPAHFANIYLFEQIALNAKKFHLEAVYDGTDGDNVVSHGFEIFREYLEKFNFPQFLYEIFLYSKYHKIPYKNALKFFLFHILVSWRLKKIIPTQQSLVKASVLKNQDLTTYDSISAVDSHKKKLNNPLHAIAFEMKYLLFKHYGLETRSPFYDQALINFCVRLPSKWKLKKGKTRFILRRYLSKNKLDLIANRASKAILTHGLIKTLGHRDIDMIAHEIQNIHPQINRIIDKKKLEKCFEKISLKQNVKDIDITNMLAFYSANIWVKQHFKNG